MSELFLEELLSKKGALDFVLPSGPGSGSIGFLWWNSVRATNVGKTIPERRRYLLAKNVFV